MSKPVVTNRELSNVRISSVLPIFTPREVKELFPLTMRAAETVFMGRQECEAIFSGQDTRMLVIVGPCSIHDPKAAIEYAERLIELRNKYSDKLCIIMRCYFEKPRTTVGWKGLWSTPGIIGECDYNRGRKLCRQIMLEVNSLGLPVATEILDPSTPQVIDDLISWGALGARTTESQTHREMASGLSFPVGIKNGTGGSFEIAMNAMVAAGNPHTMLGINSEGKQCAFNTAGQAFTQLILRGGCNGPNFSRDCVESAVKELSNRGLSTNVMIDCSHANAEGDYRNQIKVLAEVVSYKQAGNYPVNGVMIESNLCEGKQLPAPLQYLKYGVSITDGCVGWEDTVDVLDDMYTLL